MEKLSKVYAKIGESYQQIGGDCPEGLVSMNAERPGVDYIAATDGTWKKQTAVVAAEPVDPSLLAIAEALAAQETRLAKLEGGVSK